MPNTKHSSKDKNCPVFIKHKELQAIKTIDKVDNKTAHNIYNERHQHDGSLYSSVANTNNNTHSTPILSDSTTSLSSSPAKISKIETTELSSHDPLPDFETDLLPQPTTSTVAKETRVKILPRTTSKRLQTKFKASAKPSKTANKPIAKRDSTSNIVDMMDE